MLRPLYVTRFFAFSGICAGYCLDAELPAPQMNYSLRTATCKAISLKFGNFRPLAASLHLSESFRQRYIGPMTGGVAEWSNALVLKTSEGSRPPWVRIPPPPPLANCELEVRSLAGPFFFWFQRGLVVATALQRLPKQSKSVSEPHLSLIDRPHSVEGRFKIII